MGATQTHKCARNATRANIGEVCASRPGLVVLTVYLVLTGISLGM